MVRARRAGFSRDASDCAKLYFLKDEPDAQIILRTDASDYGYGAYLCQMVGEREYSIDTLYEQKFPWR